MDVETPIVELGRNVANELIPKALVGLGIPEPITRIVLGTLIGVLLQEQQNISSNEKLNRLIGKHYKDGTDLLSDAKQLQGERREEWIKKALWEFNSASNVEKGTLQQAKSQYFVGVCYDLLHESPLAKERYEKAYKTASQLATKRQYRLRQLQPFMNSLSQVLRAHGSTLSISQPVTSPAYGYFLRGETYNLKKRYQEALASYEQAILLDPNFDSTYRGKGDALISLGRYQEALAAYEQAISIEPNVGFAYRGKGDAFIGLGRYQEALAAYEQAISLGPSHRLPAYRGKGDALIGLGRYQEALAAYEQAISLDSYSATLHHNKGNALNSLGRYQEALAAYEQAISLDPNLTLAYNGKAIVLERLGRRNEAQQFYEKASQLGYIT